MEAGRWGERGERGRVGVIGRFVGFAAVLALLVGTGAAPVRAADDPLGLTDPCGNGFVPTHAGLNVLDPVDLDVLVVVEVGVVSGERAEELLNLAAEAYAPLGIDLVATFVEWDSITARDEVGVLLEVRERLGGAVPAGFDTVHAITDNVSDPWGRALCLGGVADPTLAFSYSSPKPLFPTPTPSPDLGPFPADPDYDAVVIAHEIGHLLGAKHELSNCAEGAAAAPHVRVCSVMSLGTVQNLFSWTARRFSSANALAVGGYADAYARP